MCNCVDVDDAQWWSLFIALHWQSVAVCVPMMSQQLGWSSK